MKKLAILITAIALVCFSVPALAVDWNFYGNARMWTSYIADDSGDARTNPNWDSVAFTTGALVGTKTGKEKDSGVFWDNIGTARVGAKIKHEQVQGRWELNVGGGTRLLWGQWDINEMVKLRIGQDWRPLNYFYSGQIFNDTGMAGPDGAGGVITHRDPQIKLMIGGFSIAGVDPDPISGVGAGEDVDQFMPVLEANYHLGLDMFFFDVGGAFVAYDVESAAGAGVDDTLTAYMISGGGGVNFGPAYIKGNGWYGQNVSELGLITNKFAGASNDSAIAVADATGEDFEDSDSWGVLAVIGMKVSDMLSLEGGWGYENHEIDATGFDEDEVWAAYGQVVVQLAPGVFMIPEVGYIDYMDNRVGVDEGDRTYGTIKWQINF